MSSKLIILYDNGTYETVKEAKLKPRHVDRKKVKYILSPDPTRDLVYNIVKPTELWLAHKFHSSIVSQCALIDYESSLIARLEDLPSEITTKSVIEVIQFMTTIYRMAGFLETLGNTVSDLEVLSWVYYPIAYFTEFYDKKGRLIEKALNDELLDASDESYSDGILYDDLVKNRVDGFSEFLFDIDYAHKGDSLYDLPKAIYFIDKYRWRAVKKTSNLPMDSMVAYKCEYFGSYLIITPRIYNRTIIEDHKDLDLEVVTVNRDFAPENMERFFQRYIETGNYVDLLTPDNAFDMDAEKYRDLEQFPCIFRRFAITDGVEYLPWMIYGDLIVTYLNIVALFLDLEREATLDDCCTMVRSEFLGCILNDSQILHGELRSKMGKRLLESED